MWLNNKNEYLYTKQFQHLWDSKYTYNQTGGDAFLSHRRDPYNMRNKANDCSVKSQLGLWELQTVTQ